MNKSILIEALAALARGGSYDAAREAVEQIVDEFLKTHDRAHDLWQQVDRMQQQVDDLSAQLTDAYEVIDAQDAAHNLLAGKIDGLVKAVNELTKRLDWVSGVAAKTNSNFVRY